MKINPYLVFNGTCAEAMTFYNKALGGKLDMMKFGGTPAAEHVPATSKDKIMHACVPFVRRSVRHGVGLYARTT